MSICPPSPKILHFHNLTLKIKGQGQMRMVLHNYRPRQFHRTSNGVNPSSGFKDMGSAKSGPYAAWFDEFLANGANGKITMTLHNNRSRQVHETLNGVNPSSSLRDMQSKMSGPNLCQIWQVFGAHMGQIGKWPRQCTSTGVDNSKELQMKKIPQAVTETWVCQVWQPPSSPPACPDCDENTPPARRAEG